jgi:hypothetical protein
MSSFQKFKPKGSVKDAKTTEDKNKEVELKKQYTKVQKRQFIENMLEEHAPFISIVISTIFDFLLGSAAITIQSISIVYQTSYYYIGCG